MHMAKQIHIFVTLLILLTVAWSATAQTTAPAPSLTADSLLDQIEHKAKTIKTYQAIMRFEQIQGLLGDSQIRFGKLYYVSEPKVKFAVDFQSIVTNNQLREEKRLWIYDGIWLVERLDDKKQFFKRQVHAPPIPGQADTHQADPMSMENNPFPIPLQARKAQVLKRFDVTLVTEKSEQDPDKVMFHHLILKPKPSSNINFTQVDLWYDQTSLLPIKCMTVNRDSDDEQIFSLFKAVLNGTITPEIMSTTAPTQSGWHVEVTPLKQHPH